ncbi:MAG: hypothetical protein E6Q33_06340 [Neisseriales bacterium]|nr:MAG: hypothetical protein E6Q33_06340 [Neisseriales bacterium]
MIDNLDLFADDAYMTLDGHRKITSLCGGVCFFILLIFIILLTQHFLSIYFDANDYVMSYEKAIYTSGLSEDSKVLHLTSGTDFKFLVAFNNREDFRWKDVSNQTKGVGLSLFKVKI